MPKLQDLSGRTFGCLSVLNRADDLVYSCLTRPKGQRLVAWLCRCKYCNQAKNDRSVSEFLAHARRIVEYQNAHQNPV